MKRPTREFLEKRRGVIIADLLAKAEAEDWHGVADAAMDLREIDVQLPLVESESPAPCDHYWIWDIETDYHKCSRCGIRRTVAAV